MTVEIRFAGQIFEARPSGALHWPATKTLIVADLHLGKSARMAARGGSLLPPFETLDTLSRLTAELEATRPRRVISLGDAFDDDAAVERLNAEETARLTALTSHCAWLWVSGNHDPSVQVGDTVAETAEHGISLRHIADETEGALPDLSGHYHPKARVSGRSRPAFLVGAQHLILPAFGTYTGGLDCDSDPLKTLVGPGRAILTGSPMVTRPVGVKLPTQRRRSWL